MPPKQRKDAGLGRALVKQARKAKADKRKQGAG
jgi:hypothetical protein